MTRTPSSAFFRTAFAALFCVALAVPVFAAPRNLADAFAAPSAATRPWTYWLWENTCVDEETIRADLADIRALGFGAVLLSDSRGYWDDEDHVVKPPPALQWGCDAWLDLVACAIREARRNGLQVALNVAASGGHLKGDVDVGEDAPKFLYCRRYLPGDVFEAPALPHYRDVAVFAVRTREPPQRGDWEMAGDGFYSMAANFGKREDAAHAFAPRPALEVRALDQTSELSNAHWTILRFGSATTPGHEKDVDVLDDAPVRRHLDRIVGRLLPRIAPLVGADKTFTHLYNVSWEGTMPTWSAVFEKDFRRIAGYDVRPFLPILAGFDLAAKPRAAFMRDFRHARGVMMREHLYGAVRNWAHEHGLAAFAESGGPWGGGKRNPATFGECDQIAYLGADNDFPQGEFWPLAENGTKAECGHACANGRFFTRGVVSAAHVYDRPVASIEAFTHMHRHWSVDPAFLKPLGDVAFALGINRFVWHTYTCSPRSFGVPGLEYFAGSHLNRNVTWHYEVPAYVACLHRCQELLQRGEPVVDVALLCGDRPYAGWAYKDSGFLAQKSSWEEEVSVPRGFASDVVNDDALARNPRLLDRYAVVHDCRPASARGGTVNVGDRVPDVETTVDWLWCHRKDATADWYFLAGEGKADVVFRAAASGVYVFDPVSGAIHPAAAERRADNRTRVTLDLPTGGSCFVVFDHADALRASKHVTAALGRETTRQTIAGPWRVSFAYPDGISAQPPPAVDLARLVSFTSRVDLAHFAGTATYRTSFAAKKSGDRVELALGCVPSGLAHVWLNGKDCGTVWCAPWKCDVTDAVKDGENELEIRYVNNWSNRLIGDCRTTADKRVTKCVLRYWEKPRTGNPANSWSLRPTVYSGYSCADPLQDAGLLGPVEIVRRDVR